MNGHVQTCALFIMDNAWNFPSAHMSKFVWLGRKTGKSIGVTLGEIYDEQ